MTKLRRLILGQISTIAGVAALTASVAIAGEWTPLQDATKVVAVSSALGIASGGMVAGWRLLRARDTDSDT